MSKALHGEFLGVHLERVLWIVTEMVLMIIHQGLWEGFTSSEALVKHTTSYTVVPAISYHFLDRSILFTLL